jgi:hypothetical protein
MKDFTTIWQIRGNSELQIHETRWGEQLSQ